MRFALVSREVYPFVGGGLSRYVTATAETLSELGQVTIFTSDLYEERMGDARELLPSDVEVVFVREPGGEELGSFYHHMHLWSARVYEALKRVYRNEGPDLIEFPDYQGEAFVTVQARRALEPFLRRTCVGVRLYTTSEMTSILNGFVSAEFDATVLRDLERYALRQADRIIAPGGDVYGSYERFFGPEELAHGVTIHHPVLREQGAGAEAQGSDHESTALQLLFVGRLERRKGVRNLLRALIGIERNDWALRIVGADTRTAPLGTSMRGQLELMAADDPRVSFVGEAEPNEVARLIDEADVVVLPSLWECWPNVALEAFAQSTPILATPTGGYLELVELDHSGWLTHDATAGSLLQSVEKLLNDKSAVRAVAASGKPRDHFERLTDRGEVQDRYAELVSAIQADERARSARVRRPQPVVSVVIPYYRLDSYVEETVRSAVEQTYPALEVLVVNDGSLREADVVLDELADLYPIAVLTQENAGLGSARNFGISQSTGTYVFPLDADDLAAPTYVERCVEVLEERPEIAYVTSWSRFIDDTGAEIEDVGAGYQPLGICRALESLNVAGSAEAVFRRRIFERGLSYSPELTSYEDWLHFRHLDEAGYEGYIIPERLLSYRIRDASMVRTVALLEHDRLLGEIEAHLLEARTAWTFKSG